MPNVLDGGPTGRCAPVATRARQHLGDRYGGGYGVRCNPRQDGAGDRNRTGDSFSGAPPFLAMGAIEAPPAVRQIPSGKTGTWPNTLHVAIAQLGAPLLEPLPLGIDLRRPW